MKIGDRITMAGVFKRRTFWQWLTRKPREFQTHIITAEATAAYDNFSHIMFFDEISRDMFDNSSRESDK